MRGVSLKLYITSLMISGTSGHHIPLGNDLNMKSTHNKANCKCSMISHLCYKRLYTYIKSIHIYVSHIVKCAYHWAVCVCWGLLGKCSAYLREKQHYFIFKFYSGNNGI